MIMRHFIRAGGHYRVAKGADRLLALKQPTPSPPIIPASTSPNTKTQTQEYNCRHNPILSANCSVEPWRLLFKSILFVMGFQLQLLLVSLHAGPRAALKTSPSEDIKGGGHTKVPWQTCGAWGVTGDGSCVDEERSLPCLFAERMLKWYQQCVLCEPRLIKPSRTCL